MDERQQNLSEVIGENNCEINFEDGLLVFPDNEFPMQNIPSSSFFSNIFKISVNVFPDKSGIISLFNISSSFANLLSSWTFISPIDKKLAILLDIIFLLLVILATTSPKTGAATELPYLPYTVSDCGFNIIIKTVYSGLSIEDLTATLLYFSI